MKKNNILMLAFAAGSMFAVSCSSNNDELTNNDGNQAKMVSLTIGVETEGSETTRTYVDKGNVNKDTPTVCWDSNDKIMVWGGAVDGVYTPGIFKYSKAGNNDNYAYFTGEVTEGNKYYFMYPNQTGATFNASGVVSMTIPKEQYAVSGSFDPAAAICAGYVAASNASKGATIKHACAYLKITLGNEAKEVLITGGTRAASDGGGQQYMAGPVDMNVASGGVSLTVKSTSSSTVKLIPASGASSIPAGTYLIAVIPSSSFPGGTAQITWTDNTTKSGTIDAISIESAHIYSIGEVSK